MMTKDEIITAMNELDDIAGLREIERALRKHITEVGTAAYKRNVDEYWKRAIFFRDGQTLYCNASGIFMGGPLQRGDKCKVYNNNCDARKPILWVTINKKHYGLPPSEAYRYKLLATAPEKPLSESERSIAATLSNALSDVLQ